MTTLKGILTGALGNAGVVGVGETPAAYLITEALRLANQIAALWSVDEIVYPVRETLNLVSGTASYTIGAGGTLNTARPVRILPSKIMITPTEYPLTPLDHEKFQRIADKTVSGQPRYIHYQPAAPYGSVNLFPVPDSNYQMILTSLKSVGPYTNADLNSSVNLPEGYETSLEYNTAVLLGARFGRQLSPTIYALAQSSYQSISNKCVGFRMKALTGLDPTGQADPQDLDWWFN